MAKVLYTISGWADALWGRIKHNPVVTGWLIGTIVAFAAKYGFDLDPEVVAVLIGVTTGAGAVYGRSKVEGPPV